MFKTTIIFNAKKIYCEVKNYIREFLVQVVSEKFFMWFPVFVGIGIFLTFDSFFYGSNFFYALFLLPVLLFFKKARGVLTALVIGVFVASLKLYFLSNHKMLDHEIDFIKLSGVIEKTEFIKSGTRVTVVTDLGRLKLNSLIKNVKADVFNPGNKIRFIARLYPFSDNNLGYNFFRQAFFERCYAKGVILAKPYVMEKVSRSELSILLEGIRNKINAKINHDFSPDTKGIAEALITGDKGEIPISIRNNYAKSGIAHILAISGLHITLIAGMIYFLMLYIFLLIPSFSLRFDAKKIAIILSFIAALFYVFIAGMRVPAIRALIMYGVIVIAVLFDRVAFSLRNVSIAASIILILIPETIDNPGFYMSFFVVASLVSYYEDRKIQDGYFQGIVVSSIISSFAVLPFSWYFFNQIVGNGISANLLSIPLLGFIIMPSMIGYIIGFDFFGIIADHSIKLLNLIAEVVSAFDFLFFRLATPSFCVMSIILLGMLVIIINKNKIIGCGMISFAVILYEILPKPFLFLGNDFKVFGVKDGDTFYVNDMVKSRSMTNMWRQISGAKSKQKLLRRDDIFCSPTYQITNSSEHLSVAEDNKIIATVQKNKGTKNTNIIIKR